MRTTVMVFAACLFLSWTTQVSAQPKVKSPAELLPANTLGYAELQKHGQLAKEVRELFKGSVLYNLPDSFAPLKEKFRKDHGPQGVWGMMVGNMLTAPEVASELQRIQGAAIALLEMPGNKHSTPEFVFLVQPGTSNAPSLLMRMVLTGAPVKVKETVEGVKIYRPEYTNYTAVGPGGPRVETREGEPSMAMMPGLILIGSHKAVRDCILRAKGKAEGQSLAQNKYFQETMKKLGNEPGMYVYVSTPGVVDYANTLVKGAPGEFMQIMKAYDKMVNPKAFPAVGMSMGLQKGTLYYRDMALLDPKEKSPLMEVLPSKAVNAEVLHFAPKDAILAFAISNADGELRWKKLVKLVDESFPAELLGGAKASDHLQKLEQMLDTNIGRDLMGKTTNIGFAIGNPLNAPFVVKRTEGPGFKSESGAPQIPMVLILETADDKAAQTLMELVPKISQKAANKEVKPESKKIKGQSVYSIKIKPDYAVEYGQVGSTVVIGPYAEGVAQALADGTAKKGLLADGKAMAQIKAFKEPVTLSVMKPGSFLFSLMVPSSFQSMTGEAKEGKIIGPDGKEIQPPPAQPGQPKVTVTIKKDSPEETKIKEELKKILALEPWMVLGVTRGEDYILEEGKSPGWDKFVPKLVDFAVEKLLERPGMGFGTKVVPSASKEFKKDSPPDLEKKPRELRREVPEIKGGLQEPGHVIFQKEKVTGKKDGKTDKKAGKVVFTVTGDLTKKDSVKDGFYQKVHRVELTSGKKYTIKLSSHKEKFFDTYLILQDAKGKTLAQDDDKGENLSARIFYTPKMTATYNLVVTSFREGETGKYTLTVTE